MCLRAEERKPVSYKLKKGELDAPDTPAGSPERELGEEPGSQDDSDDPARQDASEGDSEAEQAPDATNGKTGTQVSHLPWRSQASVGDAATWTLKWVQGKELIVHCQSAQEQCRHAGLSQAGAPQGCCAAGRRHGQGGCEAQQGGGSRGAALHSLQALQDGAHTGRQAPGVDSWSS